MPKSIPFIVSQIWIWIPILSLKDWVTLGWIINLSVSFISTCKDVGMIMVDNVIIYTYK